MAFLVASAFSGSFSFSFVFSFSRERERTGERLVETEPRKSRWQWIWPLLIATLVVSASTRSHVASPQVTNIDKIAHFSVYGLLATLLARLGVGWRAAVWALLATSAFGATDEWHQYYVPGRSCDVMDWVADTSGAALAVSLYAGLSWYRRLLEANLWARRIEKSAPSPTMG
jgi:VanZ family protein